MSKRRQTLIQNTPMLRPKTIDPFFGAFRSLVALALRCQNSHLPRQASNLAPCPKTKITRTSEHYFGVRALDALYAMLCMAMLFSCGGARQSIVPKLPEAGDENLGTKKRAGESGKTAFDFWDNADLIQTPTNVAAPLPSDVKRTRKVLSNKLSILSVEAKNARLADYLLVIQTGRKDEPKELKGLADLAANTWVDHAKGISRRDIVQTLDAKGGSLQLFVDFESTRVRCRMVWEERESCLKLLSSMLGVNNAERKTVENEKQKLIRAFRQRRATLLDVSQGWFRSLLWGEGDARGRNQSFNSLNDLSETHVRQWYKKHFVPNNAALFVKENKDGRSELKNAERYFRNWKPGKKRQSRRLGFAQQNGINLHIVDLPGAKSTVIKIGSKGTDPRDANRWHEVLLANLLNRAFQFHPNLKNTTLAITPKLPGPTGHISGDHGFVVESLLPHEFGLQAVQNVLDVLRNIRSEPEGSAWLKKFLPITKKEIAGRLVLQWSDQSNRIENIARYSLEKNVMYDPVGFSQTLPKIEIVDIQKSLDLVMNPDRLTVVLVGDGEILRNQFDDAGWKYQFAFADDLGKNKKQSEKADESTLAMGNNRRVNDILAKALKAKGKRVNSLKSLSWRGEATLETRQGKVPAVIRRRIVGPDKMRLDMSIQKGMVEVTTVTTKSKGWARQKNENDEQTIGLPLDEKNALRGQLWRDPDFVISRLHEPKYVYRFLGKEKIGGKKSFMIEVKGEGRRVKLYFDAKTFLLNGMKYVDKGQSATEIYKDHRTVNGIKIPHDRRVESVDSTLRYKIKKVSVNKKISSLIFFQPPQSKERIPQNRSKAKGE